MTIEEMWIELERIHRRLVNGIANKSLIGRAGQGVENEYGRMYQKLVRAGAAMQIKGKFRRSH